MNLRSFFLLCLSYFAIACSKSQPQVLLDNLTSNGGVYYFENQPFSGIGFSDWNKETRKKTVVFKDGNIKSVVRYYQASYLSHPMDSLIFDDNQKLIYQKRWIKHDLFIEKIGYENQWGPGDFKLKKTERETSLKTKLNELYHPQPKSLGFNQFRDSLQRLTTLTHDFVKYWLDFNKSNHIPDLLSGQRWRGSDGEWGDIISDLDNLDLHFTGPGRPQTHTDHPNYVEDIYIYPEFGEEGTVPGFNIHTKYINGNTKKSSYTKFQVYDYSWYFREGDKDDKYFERILNSFYHVEEISISKYRFFIRPYLSEEEDYNDPYYPIYYILDVDYSPENLVAGRPAWKFGDNEILNRFDVSLQLYSPYHHSEEKLILSTNNGFYRRSVFDKYLSNYKRKIRKFKRLLKPGNEVNLSKYYNSIYGNKFDNLEKDEYLVVAPSGLNLRSAPTSSSKVILKVDYQGVVKILNKTSRSLTVKDYDTQGNFNGKITGYWVRVSYEKNGSMYIGYIFDGYLSNQ